MSSTKALYALQCACDRRTLSLHLGSYKSCLPFQRVQSRFPSQSPHFELLFTRIDSIPGPTPHLSLRTHPSVHPFAHPLAHPLAHLHLILHPNMSNAARFYWAKIEGATNKFHDSKNEAELDNAQDICCQLINEIRCPRFCQIEAYVSLNTCHAETSHLLTCAETALLMLSRQLLVR